MLCCAVLCGQECGAQCSWFTNGMVHGSRFTVHGMAQFTVHGSHAAQRCCAVLRCAVRKLCSGRIMMRLVVAMITLVSAGWSCQDRAWGYG